MGRESNAAELLELAHLVLVLLAIQRDRMSPRNLAALLVNETAARTPVMAGRRLPNDGATYMYRLAVLAWCRWLASVVGTS